jgi:hypothetical protein
MSVEKIAISEILPDVGALAKILPAICTRETSVDPKGWSPDNPLWGQCGVVSLLANRLFGDKILGASLEGTKYAKSRFHYANGRPDHPTDLTANQFQNDYPEGLIFKERTRGDLLSGTNTAFRYTLLTLNLAEYVNGKNPLFKDKVYIRCISKALSSACQKMGFGAVLTLNGQMIATANNKKIKELAYMCDPECIRSKIQSRTESVIGACGHAEEWVMKAGRDKGINLKDCKLYVAGVNANGLPYIKQAAEHTCLRCSVQMHYAGLKSIHVPVIDRWRSLSTSEALSTAARYALGEKKVN